MLKLNFLVLVAMLGCAGCNPTGPVGFIFFNHSSGEIFVSEVAGRPAEASPGILVPVHVEDQLSEKSRAFYESIRIPDELKIIWQDGGTNDWRAGGFAPNGKSHEEDFKRADLKMPAKLINGKIRFTDLGND